MSVYAATVTSTMRRAVKVDEVTGFGMYVGKCDITNYNQTVAEITGITGKFRNLLQVVCTTVSDNGYNVRWDASDEGFKSYYPGADYTPVFTGTANVTSAGAIKDNDDAATDGHALYIVPDTGPPVYNLVAEGSSTGMIQDQDDPGATLAVQVYVVIDDVEYLPGFNLGHLEFVSPTDTHGTCTLKTGQTATLRLEDNDAAASNGTALKVQETDAGLISDMAGSNRTLIPLDDGNYLDIEDGTGGNPVTVFFDEDASTTYERLMAQVTDNNDETYKILESSHLVARPSPSQGMLAKLVTVGPGASLSVGSIRSGGPTFQVLHDPAAAQMPGAAVLNAKAAGAGFDAAVGGEQDVYLPLSNGEFVKVAYAASPTGVQVYWDHDATNSYERLMMVVVDDGDETFTTEASLGWIRDTPAGTINAGTSTDPAGEVAEDVDVGVVEFIAFGLI